MRVRAPRGRSSGMKETEVLLADRDGPALDAVDWTDHGWAAIRQEAEHTALIVDDVSTPIDAHPRFPMVRRFPDGGALVVDSRTLDGANAWLFEPSGLLSSEFHIGDGVQDLLVSEDCIVATYFDEGIFGAPGPNNDGLAVFGRDGALQWGFHGSVGPPVDISDCYCAAWHDDHTVAFLPYPGFDLVLLDLRSTTHDVFRTPKAVAGAGSVSTHGKTAWFHGPYHSRALLKWTLGAETMEPAGEYSGPLRGLSRGRFLATGSYGCTVIEP